MVTVVKGKIVDAFSQEWEMEGKKGVTQRISVYCGKGKYENISVPDDLAPFYKDKVDDQVELECDCFIRKNGTYNLKVCTE